MKTHFWAIWHAWTCNGRKVYFCGTVRIRDGKRTANTRHASEGEARRFLRACNGRNKAHSVRERQAWTDESGRLYFRDGSWENSVGRVCYPGRAITFKKYRGAA